MVSKTFCKEANKIPPKATPTIATTSWSQDLQDISIADSFNIDLQIVTIG